VTMTEPGMRAGPHHRMPYPRRFLLQSSSRGGAEPRRTRVFGPSAIGWRTCPHSAVRRSFNPVAPWLRAHCPGPR
jgi:hypothetical protein